jgi:hypothetical protein
MADIQEIERVLTEACDKAKSQKFRIAPGYTLTRLGRWKKCCPMGAVALEYSGDSTLDYARARLDISRRDQFAFMAGFDGVEKALKNRFYALGQRFRQRYVEAPR